MSPELLADINQLIVQAGHQVCGVDAEIELHARCDSFIVETNVKYPKDVGLLRDALCWVHAERYLQKLHAGGRRNRQAVESKCEEIWTFYRQLLDYRKQPEPKVRQSLCQRFDDIFNDSTCYPSLNLLLQ